MPSVAELTGLYANVLLNPGPGPGVCATCFTFTEGYARCYVCQRAERTLDVVAPISYSVAGEQLTTRSPATSDSAATSHDACKST